MHIDKAQKYLLSLFAAALIAVVIPHPQCHAEEKGSWGDLRETVTLRVENPFDGSKFYNNPVFDGTGKQVGMHNYTIDKEGNILDDSYQRWSGKVTGEGVYINYRSDNYRNGTKIIVGKDGKSTTYWWDAVAGTYTRKDPTGGKYSKMTFNKEVAAAQRRFDIESGLIDLKTVYGIDSTRNR